MITCPECGELAQDGAKFCDRCGQGLTQSGAAASFASKPSSLAVGAVLKGGLEIVEALAGTSIENRYRARRIREEKTESFIVRERFADHREEAPAEQAAAAQAPAAQADPNGPTA